MTARGSTPDRGNPELSSIVAPPSSGDRTKARLDTPPLRAKAAFSRGSARS
jgi:hypothetical protein